MDLIAVLLHILLGYGLGYGLLPFLFGEKYRVESIFLATLLGIFLETITCFLILWLGGSLEIAILLFLIIAIFTNLKKLKTFFQSAKTLDITAPFKRLKQLKWYEWGLVILMMEKLAMILWQLLRTPTYHSDALKHWSTAGKAIYGGVNFSFDNGVPELIGTHMKLVINYPLQLPIYRALGATINFGWTEFISRSDGLIFFLIICGIIGSFFYQLTKKRWITLGAIYIVASLPLQVWHAAAGYADIAVEAYLVAIVACFIKKKWWLCGVFMAGAVWSKNDGLALYMPGVAIAIFYFQIFAKGKNYKNKIIKLSQFILGFSLVAPWLIFQSLHTTSVLDIMIQPIQELLSSQEYDANDYQKILVQAGDGAAQAIPSYQLIWDYVFLGSSHGIFWLAIFLGLILLSKKMITDNLGRSLLLFFFITCCLIYYVFTYTFAYEYLASQTTIHRTLLQFSAASLLIVGYGMSLHELSVKKLKKLKPKTMKKKRSK